MPPILSGTSTSASRRCSTTRWVRTEAHKQALLTVAAVRLQICELLFILNVNKEAHDHFKRHMHAYKSRAPGEYPSIALAKVELLRWKSKQVVRARILPTLRRVTV